MDDQFGFPPPVEFLPSLTWEQIISKENHWGNPPMAQSFPRFMSSPTNADDNSPYFKTKMCWRFNFRHCPSGDRCKFAHSIEEIRRPHRVWFPREDCNSSGYTQNPSNPNRHGRFKQSEDQKLHKTKICRHSENWKRKSCPHCSTSRRCPLPQKCIYSHGDEEVKKLGADSSEAGGKSVAPAPSKASPRWSDRFPPKLNQQPGSSLPRITNLTLEKCKGIYGDWID